MIPMRYVMVLQNNFPVPSTESLSVGDSLTILLPLDRNAIASEVDRLLASLRADAERLQAALASKGVESKVVVEWGDLQHALENCLQREEAILLK